MDAPPLLSHPNLAAEAHGAIDDVATGIAQADAVYEGEYASQRVQHAHLETHGALDRALVTRLLVLDEPTEGIQPSIIKDIGPATSATTTP